MSDAQGNAGGNAPADSKGAHLRGLRVASYYLALLCLLLMCALTLWTAWLSYRTRPWQDLSRNVNQQSAPAGAESGQSTEPLTAEQKLQLQNDVAQTQASLINEIRANDTNERAILDRLITLVGVYSAILGLTAFFTLRLAREDALAQIARSAQDLENFETTATQGLEIFKNKATLDITNLKTATDGSLQNFQESTKLQLEALTKNTGFQIENFQKKIWSELPEMRNLKDSLRNLLLELERTIPAETNWNSEKGYESLNESQKQRILINEATINALQIFVSADSTANKDILARFYRALARFYLGRYRLEKVTAEGDAERADIYACKSLELETENGEAYTLRGTLYLARYRILKSVTPAAEWKSDQLALLLSKAESFLREAHHRDKKDVGASYNLAIALRNRDALDEAIQVSVDAITRRLDFPSSSSRKYMPDLYVNLAGYYGIKADGTAAADEKKALRGDAIKVLKDGHAFFVEKNMPTSMKKFIDSILREQNKDTGDFRNFDAEQNQQIAALIASENH
jgi:hypothetical protein